jgi:hypothetical protein
MTEPSIFRKRISNGKIRLSKEAQHRDFKDPQFQIASLLKTPVLSTSSSNQRQEQASRVY